MSSDDATADGDWPPPAVARRLAFLFKHAQLHLTELVAPPLEPLGIDGRELAVLSLLADEDALSQQGAAQRLAIDRTTMVALIDELESKDLVERRPHPADRRKNVVAVTREGQAVLRKGTRAVEAAERRFLAPLGDTRSRQLVDALYRLVTSPQNAPRKPRG